MPLAGRIRCCVWSVVGAGWMSALAACQYNTASDLTAPSTATTTTTTSTTGASSPSSLTYTTDVQPILASDCVTCHGPSTRAAGVDLSTYAGVMRMVVPGNASSLLILVTQSGGVMYGTFRGNASQKATTIHDWVVIADAAQ